MKLEHEDEPNTPSAVMPKFDKEDNVDGLTAVLGGTFAANPTARVSKEAGPDGLGARVGVGEGVGDGEGLSARHLPSRQIFPVPHGDGFTNEPF
ncbi:hypothetical protein BH10PAT2_BH10PAT2_3500 [soil metagenome]